MKSVMLMEEIEDRWQQEEESTDSVWQIKIQMPTCWKTREETLGSSPFNADATIWLLGHNQLKKSFGDFSSQLRILRGEGRLEEKRPITMEATSNSLKKDLRAVSMQS